MEKDEETKKPDEQEEDFEFEAEIDEGEAAVKQDQTAKLRAKIKTLKEENKKYIDELQRQKAEFQNARKHDEKKNREATARANEQLILELLPVVDSFEMAFADKQAYEKTPENWRKGVDYIYSQLLSTLEGYGVKQLHPIGEVFDPNYHEAVEQVSVEEKDKDGVILDVVQKGYLLHEKVIRSAKVKVGAHGAAKDEKNDG